MNSRKITNIFEHRTLNEISAWVYWHPFVTIDSDLLALVKNTPNLKVDMNISSHGWDDVYDVSAADVPVAKCVADVGQYFK